MKVTGFYVRNNELKPVISRFSNAKYALLLVVPTPQLLPGLIVLPSTQVPSIIVHLFRLAIKGATGV